MTNLLLIKIILRILERDDLPKLIGFMYLVSASWHHLISS